MKTMIEKETGDILICTEENEHPFVGEEWEDKCLVIKFMKQLELAEKPEGYPGDGPYFFLDKDGLNMLIQYMDYLKHLTECRKHDTE